MEDGIFFPETRPHGLGARWWLTVAACVLFTWAIMAVGYLVIVHWEH
jgi:hypothetical protein